MEKRDSKFRILANKFLKSPSAQGIETKRRVGKNLLGRKR